MKVPLGDGYWEIKDSPTRGDRAWVEEAGRRAGFATIREMKDEGIDFEQLQNVADTRTTTTTETKGKTDQEENLWLARCTIAWSFPEEINLEGVLERTDAECRPVLEKMYQLYGWGESSEDEAEGKGLSAEQSLFQNRTNGSRVGTRQL